MKANPAKEALVALMGALGIPTTDKTAKAAIKAFLHGSPEEFDASQAIRGDMIAKAEGAADGTITSDDIDFARAEWKKAGLALIEAKTLRVERKTLEVFLDLGTLYLRRLLQEA